MLHRPTLRRKNDFKQMLKLDLNGLQVNFLLKILGSLIDANVTIRTEDIEL